MIFLEAYVLTARSFVKNITVRQTRGWTEGKLAVVTYHRLTDRWTR